MSSRGSKKLKKSLSTAEKGTGEKTEIQKSVPKQIFIGVVAAVVVLRVLVSFLPSYRVDMGGYKAWSLYLADKGFEGFYNAFHVVYAPAYMYLLWITGKITTIFSLGAGGHEFFIKIWAVISDIAGGYLIYLIGRRYGKQRTGFLLGAVYSINPGVFFNSSIWGQFDSIPATLLLGVIYCFNLKRKVAAVILFAVAVLTKPQSGLLAPLVLILFFRGFSFKKTIHIRRLVYAFIGGICSYVFAVFPFYTATPFYKSANISSAVGKIVYHTADFFYWMIHLYQKSMGDYPYATANAFNLWTILGGQAVNDSKPLLGLSYAVWGFILLAFAIILSAVLILKKRNSALALYFAAYFILFGSFMFATRMHERYLLPAIIFLTVCILWDKRLWIPMGVLSLCVMANHWYLYDMAKKERFWLENYNGFALFMAVMTMVVMLYSIYYAVQLLNREGKVNIKTPGGGKNA